MHELPIISQEDALAPRHRQACGGAVRFLATCSTVEALRYEPELMSSTPPPQPLPNRDTRKPCIWEWGEGRRGRFCEGERLEQPTGFTARQQHLTRNTNSSNICLAGLSQKHREALSKPILPTLFRTVALPTPEATARDRFKETWAVREHFH